MSLHIDPAKIFSRFFEVAFLSERDQNFELGQSLFFLSRLSRSSQISSLDIDDLEDGRLIRSLLIGAVKADNLAAGLAKTSFLGLLHGESEQVVGALVRWDLEGNDTTSVVELTDD